MKTKPDHNDISFAANLPITPEIINRVENGKLTLSAPCVICGEHFTGCLHTVYQTEAVIKRVRKMDPKAKQAILDGQ